MAERRMAVQGRAEREGRVKYSKFGQGGLSSSPSTPPPPLASPFQPCSHHLTPSLCDPSHVTRPLTSDLLPEIMSICEGIFVSEGLQARCAVNISLVCPYANIRFNTMYVRLGIRINVFLCTCCVFSVPLLFVYIFLQYYQSLCFGFLIFYWVEF